MTIGLSVFPGINVFLTELKNLIEFKNQRLLKKALVEITDSALERSALNAFHKAAACSGQAFSDGFHEINSVEKSFSSDGIFCIKSL